MYGYPMLSNEVKNSYHYYGEGATCQGNIDLLKKKRFQIGVPVTDRHTQIAKWLKGNLPATDHRYNIWHMAKCML